MTLKELAAYVARPLGHRGKHASRRANIVLRELAEAYPEAVGTWILSEAMFPRWEPPRPDDQVRKTIFILRKRLHGSGWSVLSDPRRIAGYRLALNQESPSQ